MKNIVKIIVGLGVFMSITSANAQTCGTAPTCESLGYDKTAADCEGIQNLKCPFGDKFFCNNQIILNSIIYNAKDGKALGFIQGTNKYKIDNGNMGGIMYNRTLCEDKGMRLPKLSEAEFIIKNRTNLNSIVISVDNMNVNISSGLWTSDSSGCPSNNHKIFYLSGAVCKPDTTPVHYTVCVSEWK